jgi:CheY-like chemotaxis protein
LPGQFASLFKYANSSRLRYGSRPAHPTTRHERALKKDMEDSQKPHQLDHTGLLTKNRAMVRPCFLVIDREFPGSISTRKLVIETAKFNVITAYSGNEALLTFERFPKLDGIVVDAELKDISCAKLVTGLKALNHGIPIIGIAAPGLTLCEGADYHLESFDPKKLLAILQKLVPQGAAAIEAREESLSKNPEG